MDEPLSLRFPECLADDFPQELPVARAASDRILELMRGQSYGTLERHSPALKENDWPNYLRCSIARMVHAAGALRRAGVHSGRLLDYGAYFGNFSGMFADLGFQVAAIDTYAAYADALAKPVSLMRSRGIQVLDFDDVGRDLARVPESAYDVVVCAGVIEHMPHTPLELLMSINRVLKPGGYLVLDTPNVAHLYKRQALARGESVWPPLAAQFYSPIPYEGHHREYTAQEVVWMLHEVGHDVQTIELFGYSVYGQSELSGRDVTNFWKMVAEPTLREYITALSRRGERTSGVGPAPDWRTRLVETEQTWKSKQPPSPEFRADDLADAEPLLVQLQQEIALRDQLLADLHAERTRAVESRDGLLAELQEERARAVETRDRVIAEMHEERTRAVEARDRLLGELHEERTRAVEARDRKIAELHDLLAEQLQAERLERSREVSTRDRTIAELNDRIGVLQRTLDAKLSEVIKRRFRRITKT